MYFKSLTFLLIMVAGLLFSTLSAETSSFEPFIDGYSPVSYFTANKAERGNPEFSVTHNGKLYYLTSAQQVQIFNQNPDKYRPRYDVCPYSLSLGKKVPLDPTNFKVVADTLLLFHKSEGVDGLELWNNSALSDQELIERADKQYKILEF
ncbi:MAG: hypothetical protein K0U68_11155 [Gammaproteobacteria bacterium]|nr:hypothetical protein [Gammaproteobacteria bacterium]